MYKTIQDAADSFYPDGQWGCLSIDFNDKNGERETDKSMKRRHPNLKKVSTLDGNYWIWPSKK